MNQNFDRVFRGPCPLARLCAPAVTCRDSVASQLRLPAGFMAFCCAPGWISRSARTITASASCSAARRFPCASLAACMLCWRTRACGGIPVCTRGKRLVPPCLCCRPGRRVTLRMLEDDAHFVRSKKGPVPLRFKTGTSNGFRDAWTAGVVGPYVLVVWVGNFDNTPNPLLVGGDVAAPLFTDITQVGVRCRAVWMIPFPSLPVKARTLLPAKPCARRSDLDVSCAGTPSKRGIFPVVPHAIIGRILHHPH